MPRITLTAANPSEERVLAYLEENASDDLVDKINGGVIIQLDEQYLLSMKTLAGFMKYASDEARKLAEKGASSACVEDAVVFGWAIHYFEEDSILGTLYTTDGELYQPKSKTPPTPTKPKEKPKKKVEQVPDNQPSFFDFDDLVPPAPSANEEEEEPEEEPETVPVEEPAAAEPKVPPLYERYTNLQANYPDHIVVLRVGDFYEIFGDDAKTASQQLSLILTSRDFGLSDRFPMVGFPYHKKDIYLEKLRTYYNVVVAENEEDIHVLSLPQETEVVPLTIDAQTGEVSGEIPEDETAEDLAWLLQKFQGFLEVRL